jgi:hypothetical protein
MILMYNSKSFTLAINWNRAKINLGVTDVANQGQPLQVYHEYTSVFQLILLVAFWSRDWIFSLCIYQPSKDY